MSGARDLESTVSAISADSRGKREVWRIALPRLLLTRYEYFRPVRVVGTLQLGARLSGASGASRRPQFPIFRHRHVYRSAKSVGHGAGLSFLRRHRGSCRAEKICDPLFVRRRSLCSSFRHRRGNPRLFSFSAALRHFSVRDFSSALARSPANSFLPEFVRSLSEFLTTWAEPLARSPPGLSAVSVKSAALGWAFLACGVAYGWLH